MKVKELIELLQKEDGEKPIFIGDSDYGYQELFLIKKTFANDKEGNVSEAALSFGDGIKYEGISIEMENE